MMSHSTIQLAMGQMLVEGGKPEENLRRAESIVRQAAEKGAQIVVLPECLDLGWTHPSAKELAEPIPGRYCDVLREAAVQADIFIVAGLTERFVHAGDDRVYNAAVLIGANGRILLKHRKINILDIAQDLYAIGDRLAVAETPLGVIGLSICADNFGDSLCLGHSLARMGSQILLSPSAWAVPADFDNAATPYGGLWIEAYTTLAPLYGMPVVGVSNVGPITGGPWRGRQCIGCSLAVDGTGHIVAQLPYGQTAEHLEIVSLDVTARRALGTDIAPTLRAKGYRGP